MRTNSFTNNMSKKSNKELEEIIQQKDKYTNEALQAVVWLLEDRGLLQKDEIVIEGVSNIVEEKVEIKINKEPSFEEFEQPLLYSKSAIQGFTIFFSPFFGAILLMSNLKAQKKQKARNQVLLFVILYTIITYLVLSAFPTMMFLSLAFNVLGSLVLIEYFWNKNLGKNIRYTKKGITKPLLISFLVVLLLVFIQFLPQLMGEQSV
ncbi:hypothetical protein [Polaribacter sargassicola]|uniref:hypothetical protein n=1 Tax=Polaribacter sargassicola TaxID=2836891 RepID=UPI001F1B6D0B|nr:hypothetical protein [Polaribacter sp. DS7-9]MCG1037345.1 hypothetical protein [Polaribacter sp. DS7-9]